jgi:hypothetical protein
LSISVLFLGRRHGPSPGTPHWNMASLIAVKHDML